MAEENFLTDIERTLKKALEDVNNINLHGNPVPVKVVTPDPDFVEVKLPCLTLQLVDFRRDLSRADNQRQIEKDIDAMVARIRRKSEPYNLHYSIVVHTERNRDDRLLLGEIIFFIDEHPVMTSLVSGKELYLHRDISFRELSRERSFAKSIGIIVKTRLDARYEEIIPLVKERKVKAHLY